MAERIGVYGGTFDPPHIGHLVVGVEVVWALSLDRLLFVVANDPWQKTGDRSISEASARFAMTEAALAPFPSLEASDVEIRRGGPSYTIETLETLETLEALAPTERVTVVLGADAAAGLPTWHRAAELARRAHIAVVDRPGFPIPDLGAEWSVERVSVPAIDVSSRGIRRRVAEGRPIEALVPQAVRTEITARGLYRERR